MDRKNLIALCIAAIIALALFHVYRNTAQRQQANAKPLSDADLMFYEAIRRGYVMDDLIVRRELVRRVRDAVIQEHPQVAPTDADLAAYLTRNADKYQAAARYSFDQVYLSRGAHGAKLSADAASLTTKLDVSPEKFSSMGDPFPRGHHLDNLTLMQIEAIFGHALAQSIATLPKAQWQGPLESPLGLHFVRITAIVLGRTLTLDEARSRLLIDYQLEQQRNVIRDALLQLRQNFSGAAPLPKPAAFDDEDSP